MVKAVTMKLRQLPLLIALLAFPSAAFAHRLDEYLQATLVAIKPVGFRLQINLTPGVAVAEQVIALIDRDRDGVISTNEAAGYAELLKRDLIVRLDQRSVELKLATSFFPEPTDLRTGLGIIQVEFSVTPDKHAAGLHKLSLENRHLPGMSVYLFNSAQPESASVRITGQKRNENQSTGEIVFDLQPQPSRSMSVGIGIVVSLAALFLVLFAVVWQRGSPKSRTSPRGLLLLPAFQAEKPRGGRDRLLMRQRLVESKVERLCGGDAAPVHQIGRHFQGNGCVGCRFVVRKAQGEKAVA
jgi:hypothetical protein